MIKRKRGRPTARGEGLPAMTDAQRQTRRRLIAKIEALPRRTTEPELAVSCQVTREELQCGLEWAALEGVSMEDAAGWIFREGLKLWAARITEDSA
jgi:hypothetical protein